MAEPESAAASATPRDRFAFVIDDNDSICRILSLTLASFGVECATFSNARDALAALDARRPVVMFLDVALSQSDAIDVVHGLNARHYDGVVHLMSGNPSLIEAVQRIGARKGVTFGVPLHKPFRRETILGILEGLGLTRAEKPSP
jgi:two-component system, NtrC family, nitrogen regulation response regulator NtrX